MSENTPENTELPAAEAVGSTELLADLSSPWMIEPDYSGVIHKCGLPICDIRGHKHNLDRAKKNARLIAAAPAMLRLIESIAPWNKSARDFLDNFTANDSVMARPDSGPNT